MNVLGSNGTRTAESKKKMRADKIAQNQEPEEIKAQLATQEAENATLRANGGRSISNKKKVSKKRAKKEESDDEDTEEEASHTVETPARKKRSTKAKKEDDEDDGERIFRYDTGSNSVLDTSCRCHG